MSLAIDGDLIARNPATGEELGRAVVTPPEAVAGIVERAQRAQEVWGDLPWSGRRALLNRWRRIISRDADLWADLIRAEIGKPPSEAAAGDVIPTLDALRWAETHGGAVLADERVGPGWQRLLLTPTGRLRWRPLGVVGMIGTWNYPLFLNAVPIAQALAAGCGVVWKPSEFAVASGQRLQASLEEAGLPSGLVGLVQGRGEVGRALMEAPIAKMMFTGSVETGRRALATAAARGIPGVIELSGFDPAVILPDAPLETTVRTIVWASMVGCGQTCVAVKRALIVGDPTPWVEAFAAVIHALRVGDPARPGVDVGPLIHPSARDRFDETIRSAVRAGAEIVAGGRPIDGPGAFYEPTLLLARDGEPEKVLEGVFGPVLLIRGLPDVEAAVEAANSGRMALAASVWGRDRRKAREVARRIVAGMTCVNEAVTPTASASAPFGGFKASGFGRTHGALGLREFAAPQVLFERRSGGFRPQLFPYGQGPSVDRFLKLYRRLFHPSA